MAWDLRLLNIPGAEAAADQSTKQFHCVKKTATGMRFGLCDADGEVFHGVQQDKPSAAGQAMEVMAAGISRVVAGETLVASDHWGTDANGKAKKIEVSNTGADTGDFVMGVVLEGAATNGYAVVTVGLTTFKVESV